MKNTTLFIFATAVLSCAPITPQKVNAGAVSEKNKLNAYHFAKAQFESCTTGKYPNLSIGTATPHLVKTLTHEDMKNACEKINRDCGELQALDLQEILKDNESYIYRYKATYAATNRQPEIRVYTNFRHQFDGIIYKPEWQDRYAPFNP